MRRIASVWRSLRRNHGHALAVGGGVILAAIFGLLLWGLLDLYIKPDEATAPSSPSTAKKDLMQAWGFIMAGVAGGVGIYFTWLNLQNAQKSLESTQKSTEENLQLTREGQITERFTRAIDQLGAIEGGEQKLEIRIGGIYALERLSKDSRKDYYETVMEILTAYIRQNARRSFEERQTEFGENPEPPADIQAIITVLRRREKDDALDLRETNLRGADFKKANLQEAYLQGADLGKAHLGGAHLERAKLRGAILREARLMDAHLNGADLGGKDISPKCARPGAKADPVREGVQAALREGLSFQEAAGILAPALSESPQERNLRMLIAIKLKEIREGGAHLRGAHLANANLVEAYLICADLRGADLMNADLREADLTSADLRGADLTSANLGSARLCGAKLAYANLYLTRLEFADLRGAEELTQEQVDQAMGHETTQLPDHLQRPPHWSKGDKESEDS